MRKLSIHCDSGHSDAARWAKTQHDRGTPFAVALVVDNVGLAVEIKRNSPSTIVILRVFGDEDWGIGRRIENGDNTQTIADEWFSTAMGGKVAKEITQLDGLALMNECGLHGVENYRRLADVSMKLATLTHQVYGIRYAHLGISAGEPIHYNEYEALASVGFYRFIRANNEWLFVHEGVSTVGGDNPPIDAGVTFTPHPFGTAQIPGAPFVVGAGPYNLRHKFHYRAADVADFKTIVSEMVYSKNYSTDPANIANVVSRASWYELNCHPNVVGVLPFTVAPTPRWQAQDYGPFYETGFMPAMLPPLSPPLIETPLFTIPFFGNVYTYRLYAEPSLAKSPINRPIKWPVDVYETRQGWWRVTKNTEVSYWIRVGV